MLSTLLGWLRESDIRIVVLVVVALAYAAGAISRWRQGSRRRHAFYIAAGILLALWEWHMVWWLFVGAALAFIAGIDDLWRGDPKLSSQGQHPGMTSKDTGKET